MRRYARNDYRVPIPLLRTFAGCKLTPPLRPRYSDFNLSPELLQGVAELNYTHPTPVQALVLQPALDGQDMAGQAPTGSGKTAAYGLAILAQVDPSAKAVQAIVLVPARELAPASARRA